MQRIEDMFADPEPLDENDPAVLEEMFDLYESFGWKPEDLGGLTQRNRAKYAVWLRCWAAERKSVKAVPAKVANEAALQAKKDEINAAPRYRMPAGQKKSWATTNAAKDAAKKIPANKVAKKAALKKAVAAKKAHPKNGTAKAMIAAMEKATRTIAKAKKSSPLHTQAVESVRKALFE